MPVVLVRPIAVVACVAALGGCVDYDAYAREHGADVRSVFVHLTDIRTSVEPVPRDVVDEAMRIVADVRAVERRASFSLTAAAIDASDLVSVHYATPHTFDLPRYDGPPAEDVDEVVFVAASREGGIDAGTVYMCRGHIRDGGNGTYVGGECGSYGSRRGFEDLVRLARAAGHAAIPPEAAETEPPPGERR